MSGNNPDVVSRYYTTKHSWRGKYKRMMAIGKSSIVTLNPSSWEVTNTWPYGDNITDILPSSKSPVEFILATEKGKKNITFSCDYRADLLTDANMHRNAFTGGGSGGKKKGTSSSGLSHRARKYHWSEQRTECLLVVTASGLSQVDPRTEETLCTYFYKDIEGITPISDLAGGFALSVGGFGRLHVFQVEKREDLIKAMAEHALTYIGIVLRQGSKKTISVQDFQMSRFGKYSDDDSITSMAEFLVNKESNRHGEPIARILCLSERCLIERDPATYNIVTLKPLMEVFALIRCQDDVQKFIIEYKNGSRRVYVSTERDSLLATLLDGVRASGNRDVYIRLIPTNRANRVGSMYTPVDEDVETVYLKLLSTHDPVASGMSYADAIVNFNTNVDYSGLHHAETKDSLFAENKEKLIMNALQALLAFDERGRGGTLTLLNINSSLGQSSALVASSAGQTAVSANSDSAVASAASPSLVSADGKRGDPAWTSTLSKAAAATSAELFLALRRLVASKAGFDAFTTLPGFREKLGKKVIDAIKSHDEGSIQAAIDMLCALMQPMHDNYNLGIEQTNKAALLMSKDFMQKLVDLLGIYAVSGTGALAVCALLDFFTFAICAPYSETTEPDQFDRLLEMIANLSRRLFKLYLHPSMAIIKGAGMIMKAIIEEGSPEISARMQQLALSECALLKHLHVAIFTTSSDTRLLYHRELSRQLVGLWTAENEDSKLLVKRMLPKGLLGFLDSKDPPPKEELFRLSNRDNLKSAQTLHRAPTELQIFLRHWKTRIGIQGKQDIAKPVTLRRRRQHVKVQRNWPMLYYQIKQDHARPDLIWNHKTREELRETCEAELRAFNIDKDLSGNVVVSWNYIEFEVHYESLNEELKIGDHYVRILLDQGATQNHVDIHDPPVFFNDLYHRFLLATTPSMKVLCLQALAIVYGQCYEEIGTFNDTPFIVSMLNNASTRLERDRLVVFLEKLLYSQANTKLFIDAGGIRILVEMLTLCHLHTERAATPLQSNVLEAGADMQRDSEKEWYYSAAVNASNSVSEDRLGPFGFDEMREKYKAGTIHPLTRCWSQGMEGWRKLQEISQLKWNLIHTEAGAFNETQLAAHLLSILIKICDYYPSRDVDGAVVRPIPRAKRMLCEPVCLPHIVNVFLTFDPSLVEKTATLLNNIMQDNPIMPKLYLTGAFFFAMMYTGSNVLPIARFLANTHTMQSFRPEDGAKGHEITRRSVLGTILPEAMVCYLTTYGPEKFSEIFLGEFDTPEAIWNHEMRRLMIEKLALHLAEFSPRLMSNTRALYQYAPIPTLQYPQLEQELFCNVYYLRHLCDEVKFPDWPIADPIALLKDALDEWHIEVEKKAPTISSDEALTTLGLDPTKPVDENAVRKAYFKLAGKYHPDKNPEGRDMFEKILKAYEYLSSLKSQKSGGPDPRNINLLLKTQSIIFSRFADVVRPYKYAGYPMLIKTIQMESTDSNLFSKQMSLLPFAAELAFHTVNVSSLNAEELRRENGLEILAESLSRCVSVIQPSTGANEMPVCVSRHIVRCFSAAANFEHCREKMRTLPSIVIDVSRCVSFKNSPLLSLAAVECVAQLALDSQLQEAMLDAGILWHLLSLLFKYDFTLDESGVQVSADSNKQESANAVAKVALRSLARLGGLLSGEDATPKNNRVLASLTNLITGPLARRMSQSESSSMEVLKILNSNSEHPYLIWNNGTRAELIDFAEKQSASAVRSGDHDKTLGVGFVFSDLASELKICDVYIRVYIEQPATPLEDAAVFCQHLLQFLSQRKALLDAPMTPQESNGNTTPPLDEKQRAKIRLHCRMVCDAFRVCIVNNQGVEKTSMASYEMLFALFRYTEDPELQLAALKLVEAIVANKDCVAAIAEANVLVDLVLLFEFLPVGHEIILSTLQSLASKPKLVADSISRGVVIHLLHLFASSKRTAVRESAAQVLVKLVSDKLHGPKVTITVSKFMPAIFVDAMRESIETSIHMFEAAHENPELIWNDDARTKVKKFLSDLKTEIVKNQLADRNYMWRLPDDFEVVYSELQGELLVGGVYLRLFLKQPGWGLRNPRQFLIALFDRFISYASRRDAGSVDQSMLEMISQSVVLLLKAQNNLLDQVAAAGHIPKLVQLLDGTMVVVQKAVIEVIYQLADSQACVDALVATLVLKPMMKTLNGSRELSGMGADAIRRMVEKNNPEKGSIVQQALQVNLVPFLLTLLDGGVDQYEGAAAMKAQIVKALKAMAADLAYGPDVEKVLANSPIWAAFKDQRHDLFLTTNAVAGYLTGPVSSVKGYLTAGPSQTLSNVPPPTDQE